MADRTGSSENGCLTWDKRPYKTKESIEKNINIRRNTRKTGITETPFGIKQLH